jgi:hypothetical protein
MKIALCFHGNTGFKEKLRGNNLVDLEPLDIKLPIKSIKENLVNDHETDIFIHTWSKDKKKEIIKELAPVKSVFENHKNFSSDFKDRKNATLSKYYSVEQVNKLKKEYEQKNNFRYDAVFHTRFDLVWFSKIPIEQDFKDKYLFFPNWNTSKSINNLGPFNKDNMHIGQRVFDAWFFTSSKVSDSYTKIYSNRRKLNKLSNKSWSSHRFAYLQAEIYNYEVRNILYRGYDYELYRRYLNQDWKNSEPTKA